MSKKKTETNESRRDFMKKAAYTAPVIMTMAAVPSMHAVGSVVNNDPTTPTDPGQPPL